MALRIHVRFDVLRRQLLPGFQMFAALADPLPTRVLGRHLCHWQLLPWGWWGSGVRQSLHSASESKRERERDVDLVVDSTHCGGPSLVRKYLLQLAQYAIGYLHSFTAFRLL